jgi:hypothetical protein
VRRRAADCFHDPRRQVREIIRHTPRTRGSALVEPGNLAKHWPLVVLEIIDLMTTAGLKNHDIDALLRQFVTQCATAGTRTHNHDDFVVEAEFLTHGCLLYS